jgi:hypothetical protein
MLIASYGSLVGFRTEAATRAGIIAGFPVALGALAILMARRRTQTPEDYQRVRWVIWGCLIGLPAFLIAELASETTLFETRWGDFTPREDVIGLLYLVNGILCLFVFEAIRRPRVVSVSIPLRRVTILGLTLSLPLLLLHHEVERIQESLQVPGWAWLAIGAIAIFLITRLHEGAVHLADRFFNRALDAAELELGAAMLNAKEPARDRPASGAGAVPKAQSDLGRLVSSGRTKVREGKKRQGMGRRRGSHARRRRGLASPALRRDAVQCSGRGGRWAGFAARARPPRSRRTGGQSGALLCGLALRAPYRHRPRRQ